MERTVVSTAALAVPGGMISGSESERAAAGSDARDKFWPAFQKPFESMALVGSKLRRASEVLRFFVALPPTTEASVEVDDAVGATKVADTLSCALTVSVGDIATKGGGNRGGNRGPWFTFSTWRNEKNPKKERKRERDRNTHSKTHEKKGGHKRCQVADKQT